MKPILLLLLSLIIVLPVDAALQLNELYPSPDKLSTEWIELLNSGPEPIMTNGYLIRDAANNTLPLPSQLVESDRFLIATATSLLNNSGDTVYLINPAGEIIDIATYSATLSSIQSFARCSDNRWVVTTAISREQPNLDACILPSVFPTPLVTPGTTPLPTVASLFPSPTLSPIPTSGIPVVSEVMTSPHSGEREWIELYNPHSFALSLTKLQIDDGEGGSRPKFLSGTIPPQSYYVVILSSGIFNNDGDQVRLLSDNNTVLDSFTYVGGKKGMTWGRQHLSANSPVCMMIPSPENINAPCMTSEDLEPDSETENNTGSNSGTGGDLKAAKTTSASTSSGKSHSSVLSTQQTPTAPEEYTAAFSPLENSYADFPVSVQLHSPEKPDSRSTSVALTVSLTSSLFTFLSILFKINRVYLPL
jgi:hypothetical protein